MLEKGWFATRVGWNRTGSLWFTKCGWDRKACTSTARLRETRAFLRGSEALPVFGNLELYFPACSNNAVGTLPWKSGTAHTNRWNRLHYPEADAWELGQWRPKRGVPWVVGRDFRRRLWSASFGAQLHLYPYHVDQRGAPGRRSGAKLERRVTRRGRRRGCATVTAGAGSVSLKLSPTVERTPSPLVFTRSSAIPRPTHESDGLGLVSVLYHFIVTLGVQYTATGEPLPGRHLTEPHEAHPDPRRGPGQQC